MNRLEPDFDNEHYTPESIRKYGEKMLYRALNIDRLIGFVGSGVSISYGRVNWKELINNVKKKALDGYDSIFVEQVLREALGEFCSTEKDISNIDAIKEKYNTLIHDFIYVYIDENEQKSKEKELDALHQVEIDKLCRKLKRGAQNNYRKEYLIRVKEIVKTVLTDCKVEVNLELIFNDLNMKVKNQQVRDERIFSAKKWWKDTRKFLTSITDSSYQSNLRTDELNVLILDICEEIFSKIDRHNPGNKNSFREEIKESTKDDKSYSKQNYNERMKNIRALFENKEKSSDNTESPKNSKSNIFDEIEKCISKPDIVPPYYLFYSEQLFEYLRTAFLKKSKNCIETEYFEKVSKIIASVSIKLKNSNLDFSDDFPGLSIMPPDRRSFFSIIFLVLYIDNAKDAVSSGLLKWKELIEEDTESNLENGSLKDNNYYIRSKIDPIHSIFNELKIKRFLTTNYDLEFERYLEHHDFPIDTFIDPLLNTEKEVENTIEGYSRIGHKARSMIFGKSSNAELIEFAVGMPDIHTDIFHLHGRAGNKDPLIVTERDYQKAYLRNDKTRRLFNESLEIMFSGNPILFIGLGMSEADLLRPLRQFVSDRAGITKRPLFALLPATGNRHQRDEQLLNLYVRYGVYTLYFGEPKKDGDIGLDKQYKLLDDLITLCDAASEEKNKAKYFATVGDKQYEPTSKTNKIFNNLVCEITGEKELKIEVFVDKFKNIENESSMFHRICEVIKIFYPLIQKIEVDNVTFSYVICRLLIDIYSNKNISQSLDLPAACSLMLDFLKRLKEKVLSKALCIEMENISEDWREWWSDWKKKPDGRSVEFAQYSENENIYLRHCTATNNINASKHSFYNYYLKNLEIKSRTIRGISAQGFNDELVDGEWKLKQRLNNSMSFLILHNKRGGGKGMFLHSLMSNMNTYNKSFIVSASLSCEYSSAIEGIIEFIEIILNKEALSKEDFSRNERLRCLLNEPALNRLCASKYLLVLSSVELLFNAKGEPITTEFSDLFKLLVMSSSKKSLLDVIILHSTDQKIEAYFRKLSQTVESEKKNKNSNKNSNEKSYFSYEELSVVPANMSGFKCWLSEREKELKCKMERTSISSFFYEIDQSLEHNFYGFNLLTSHLLNVIRNVSQEVGKSNKQTLLDSYECWRKSLTSRLSKTPRLKRMEVLIGEVIDSYAASALATNDYKVRAKNALDNLILRHMAFFSIPIDSDVLSFCSQITELIDIHDLVDGGKTTKEKRIKASLEKMEERGLVLPLSGRQEAPAVTRYALHRHLRTFVFNRTVGIRLERSETHFYDISTYAVQPHDASTLSTEMYHFLSGVITDLISSSAYLDISELQTPEIDIEKISRIEKKLSKISKCFRAALGILRSSFSLAVISRIELPEDNQNSQEPSEKYFDSYGKYFRDLLEFNVTLDKRLAELNENKPAEISDNRGKTNKVIPSVPLPFYLDEIVWLYNERGLVALTQGKLYDAIPLFEQALKVNQDIEQGEKSFNWRRIRLNQAIAQIERGNLTNALTMLEDIESREESIKEPTEESKVDKGTGYLIWLTKGYLALIFHLTGQLERACNEYEEVIKSLSDLGRNRAVSIFCRHLGDLYRILKKQEKAEEYLNRAVASAESIRDQDVLHYARIAQAKACLVQPKDISKAIALLDLVQQYAHDMGLPKLEADALIIHGQIILDQGENKLAGEMAVKSLAICSMNGLNLRKITSLTLIGQVNINRKNEKTGLRLLNTAIKLAERYKYQLGIERAQQIIHATKAGF